MSECVVRMEFSKNCLDCDLHQTVYDDSSTDTDVYCFKEKRFVGKRFGPTKDLARPSWCPIICKLPERHGRLVDADDFIKHLFTEWAKGEISNSEWCEIRQWMNEATAIVPAEAERSEA